jgi:hypothetical protein
MNFAEQMISFLFETIEIQIFEKGSTVDRMKWKMKNEKWNFWIFYEDRKIFRFEHFYLKTKNR